MIKNRKYTPIGTGGKAFPPDYVAFFVWGQ